MLVTIIWQASSCPFTQFNIPNLVKILSAGVNTADLAAV